jgi:hypothetical protein
MTMVRLRTRIAGTVLALGLALGAYAGWPRRADLREFDPARVARLETDMWRDYYEQDYGGLFAGLYALQRDVYGFSPWDSARIAGYAAKGAKEFQPSRSREEAQRALPALTSYFAILRERGSEDFDAAAAARLELDWWQLRREGAGPERYGEAVARVDEEVFGVRGDDLRRSGVLRAEMMAYRDERRDGRMREEDWRRVEEGLTRSYELLHAALHAPR